MDTKSVAVEESGGEIRRRNQALILQASAEEFAKYGFKGTSLQSIADKVSLPKANILYYFKSKTGLYKALLQDIVTMWNDGFAEEAASQPPNDVLAAYINKKMRYSREHPQASKIFAMEIIQGAPVIGEDIHLPMIEWSQKKITVIQAWVEQGLIRPVQPMYLLYLIWGATQFYADFDTEIGLLQGKSLTEQEFDEARQFIVDMVLRGIAVEKS
ncbi:TetR family transcriptional regulator [Photobacterium rosenbergii]|uniref:TetR family transcriptional regulator n=1 Tax=Photobacterium rosenbergii TaxID=294936 RepID=A0A2T3NHZ4_9GAMM|nr:TetR family transcriptional regulator C-terminal domain-containing protein [Photobacterium rosenbergii]PSW14647.1 TetR family transcriptional regulator [Photobacterium rosenbergii]